MGVMQHEAPPRPLRRPGIEDGRRGCDEIAGRSRADEACHLLRRLRRPVHGSRPARGRVTGDAPAPGIGRLRRAAIGVFERVVFGDIHQHEGIERHFKPARLQIGDRGHHALIGRGAAIGRTPAFSRNLRCGGPRQSAGKPCQAGAFGGAVLHRRADAAVPASEIVAEPRHHHRHPLQIGAQRLQLIERGLPIGCRVNDMAVGGHAGAGAGLQRHRIAGIDELAGTGDQADGAHHLLQPVDGTDHLHRDLRQTVAETGERHAFEHQIGRTAIGRRMAQPLPGLYQRIGFLILSAEIAAHGDPGRVEKLAVAPRSGRCGQPAPRTGRRRNCRSRNRW